jgi:hypothetical protein
MTSHTRGGLSTRLVALLALTLGGCAGASPEDAQTSLLDALSRGDSASALKFLSARNRQQLADLAAAQATVTGREVTPASLLLAGAVPGPLDVVKTRRESEGSGAVVLAFELRGGAERRIRWHREEGAWVADLDLLPPESGRIAPAAPAAPPPPANSPPP